MVKAIRVRHWRYLQFTLAASGDWSALSRILRSVLAKRIRPQMNGVNDEQKIGNFSRRDFLKAMGALSASLAANPLLNSGIKTLA